MMYQSLVTIKEHLANGQLSAESLVDLYLSEIDRSKALNIYIEVWGEEAKSRAKALDRKFAEDTTSVGSLYGVVLSIKDVICYKDHVVSAGSKILAGFSSQITATAVQHLLDEDAIIIGRTNCDEFAMGSTNENSYYGPTLNGADDTRVPGGSSGGAAVSVQMNTCLVALGSDTGGSVRQPAAFTNTIGFKPSYGAVSRYGLIAYGSSFDQIGLISKDLDTLRLVNEIINGKDEMDATSVNIAEFSGESRFSQVATFSGIGEREEINEDIRDDFQMAQRLLLNQAINTVEVDFDLLEYLVPCYYVLTTAEASSNLNRYDGIRYGYQTDHFDTIEELYTNSRSEGFGDEVKRRIMMGTFVLSVGYYDAYFTKAQQVRSLIVKRLEEIFTTNDFLILPTTTDIPWKLGEATKDPVSMYLADIFTVLANLAGLPAISLPMNFTGERIFSSGLQIIGPYGSDQNLLKFANAISGTLVAQ